MAVELWICVLPWMLFSVIFSKISVEIAWVFAGMGNFLIGCAEHFFALRLWTWDLGQMPRRLGGLEVCRGSRYRRHVVLTFELRASDGSRTPPSSAAAPLDIPFQAHRGVSPLTGRDNTGSTVATAHQQARAI